MAHARKFALAIGGSDPTCSAGVGADVLTFLALGVQGGFVVTAITAQSASRVRAIAPVPAGLIREQFEAALEDRLPDAIKIGMLPSAEAIRVVASVIRERGLGPVVLDPVMRSTSGVELMPAEAQAALRAELLPLVDLLTPNAAEAAALTGSAPLTADDAGRAAREILANPQGAPRAVLIKGGHLSDAEAVDLFFDGDRSVVFSSPRVAGLDFHGSGCVFSSAIAAHLALGADLAEAIGRAKRYLDRLFAGGGLQAGGGRRLFDHVG